MKSLNLEQKTTLTAEARSKELDSRWAMTQLFFAIHSGLFAAILFQHKEMRVINPIACLVGLLLGINWLHATIRSQRLLAYWNEKLAALELRRPGKIRVFVSNEGKIPSPQGTPMDDLLIRLVWIFILAWSGLFVFFSFTLLSKGG
jgi:hypothetical protein